MSIENKMRIQNAIMILMIVAAGKYFIPYYVAGIFIGVFITFIFFYNMGILNNYKNNKQDEGPNN